MKLFVPSILCLTFVVFSLSCSNVKESYKCSIESKTLLRSLAIDRPIGNTKVDTAIRDVKAINLLNNYNASCKLGLKLDKILLEAYREFIYEDDSSGIKNILTIDALKFDSENTANEVYQLIQQKVSELNNTERKDIGNFCVWSPEAHIHNVQAKSCIVFFINKQGDFPTDLLKYVYNYLTRP